MRLSKLFGYIVIVSSFVGLLACQQQHDYEYYLSHPDVLEKTYARCSEMSGPAAYADQDCVAAINAAQAIKVRLMDATANPEAFGVELLHLQTQYGQKEDELAQLMKSTANDAEKTKLIAAKKEELQQMKDDIQARQTVIGLVRTNLR